MKNLKYTPMQILQDNIKQKINQLEGHEQVRWIAEMEAYRAVLDMIQGDSLGKPLLEQEAELLGIETELEEELPKKGQICWGRHDVDDEWDIGHFMEKDEFGHYILSSCNNRKNSFPNTEITTKNPYEEEDREPQVGDMCYFWDSSSASIVVCSELCDIRKDSSHRYCDANDSYWRYCSLKNPLIK